MGYLYAWWNYVKTQKGQHDLLDYIRAAIIMASVMAMLRIMLDMICSNF
jgi:hypothetical protein